MGPTNKGLNRESLLLNMFLEVFELDFSLMINFSKTSLIGINIDPSFMNFTSDFTHCYHQSLSLKYLGLPVGDNLRLKTT